MKQPHNPCRMSIADFVKLWVIQVDASSETVGAACLQCVKVKVTDL